MKKIFHKIQDLGNKAAQIQQAVQSVPARAAELRDAVATTTGQLQQMRSDIQSTVSGLRAESEERLVQMLREIDGGAETLDTAGFHLADVEMELGVAQRLIVHLEKVRDVSASSLRSLAAVNESRKTIHAILSALARAEDVADKVSLENLSYHKLTVYVGQVPTVRLCWGAELAEESTVHAAPAGIAAGPPPLSSSSAFQQSSYFERRPSATAPPASSPPAPTLQVAPPIEAAKMPASPPAPVAESGDWKKDALARFKKMPDLSKPRY